MLCQDPATVADGLLFCPFVGKMGQEHITALYTPEALPGKAVTPEELTACFEAVTAARA